MSKELFQLAEIRYHWSKITGEAIEHYFPFDREATAEFQAGLVALKINMAAISMRSP